MRFYLKLPMINRLALAAKAKINTAMVTGSTPVSICKAD